MTLNELFTRQSEITASMQNANEEEYRELEKEYNSNKREIELKNQKAIAERNAPAVKGMSAEAVLREVLQDARKGNARELQFRTAPTEVTLAGAITDSGAINLTVKDVVPNLEEGTGLPAQLSIVTGVTGDVLYPTSKDDVELEIAGETETMDDQVIDFDKLTVSSKRVTASVDISNNAIDNAAFPILQFVQAKFAKAWRKLLASHIFSQAEFSSLPGPFAGMSPSGTITLGNGSAYASILAAVADFTDKGFSAEGLCLVMDAVTEANLKAEPKCPGFGGFVIENGKCAGYDYVVSHYINTELDDDALVATEDRYIGIGYWDYLAVQTHGQARLNIDGTSKAVAKKNCVNITLNQNVSITDISSKLYGEDGNVKPAFALYKAVVASAPAALNVAVTNTADAPVIISGGVTVDNTTASPVNTKEVTE